MNDPYTETRNREKIGRIGLQISARNLKPAMIYNFRVFRVWKLAVKSPPRILCRNLLSRVTNGTRTIRARGDEEFTFPRLCDVFHWPGRLRWKRAKPLPCTREPDTTLEISWSMIEPGFRPISRRTLQSALTSDAFAIWFILGLPIRSASRGSPNGFSRVSAIFLLLPPSCNDKSITQISF